MSSRSSLRCAIYTRKSTDEGLDQDFNTLDAQREACEAYVRSQASERWKPVATRYDDGGYSGGTMDRPALRSLLDDIEAGRIDVVVVYKIDRLTRSLTDFARIIEVLDKRGASFVSVTQQFNTTTSMGRLTLNVLLSFAQFEREVTAERIRDKIAASKKKGMWMGGSVPLGYDVRDRRLVVNEDEAQTVLTLFRSYLQLGSVRALRAEADRLGLVTKIRRSPSGRISGGTCFSRGHLYHLLSNPIYIGRIANRGETYPGLHDAIIDQDLWDAVQQRLGANRQARHRPTNAREPSLLAGLVFDETGDRLSPSHAVKDGRRYRYYISHRLMEDSRRDGDGWRLPAREFEHTVINAIARLLKDRPRIAELIDPQHLGPRRLERALGDAGELALRLSTSQSAGRRQLIQEILKRVEVSPGELHLEIDRVGLCRLLVPDASEDVIATASEPIDLRVAMTLRRRGVEARLIIEGAAASGAASAPDPGLVRLVATAHRCLDALSSGKAASINDVARMEGMDASDVTRIIPLAFLAPDIVEAALDGRQPMDLTAKGVRELCPLPADWAEQRRLLGFPARADLWARRHHGRTSGPRNAVTETVAADTAGSA